MGTDVTDFDQMMKTLAQASTDPNAVSVGDFAKAVQSLQAELKMLEAEVDRLGGTVETAFKPEAVALAKQPKRSRKPVASSAKPRPKHRPYPASTAPTKPKRDIGSKHAPFDQREHGRHRRDATDPARDHEGHGSARAHALAH